MSAGAVLAITLALQAAGPPPPTLTGKVVGPDGRPLKGATVYVHTAREKVGPSTL